MDYQSLSKVLPKLPRKWTTSDISIWLTFINLESLYTAFKQHSVDGSIIYTITQEDLRQELGVKSSITVKKIMNWVSAGLKQYSEYLATSQLGRNPETLINGERQQNLMEDTRVNTAARQTKNSKKTNTQTKYRDEENVHQRRQTNKRFLNTEEKNKSKDKLLILRTVIDGVESVAHQLTERGGNIGSNLSCNIVNTDLSIDAFHAEIFFEENDFMIMDLGSRNGTFYKIEDKIQLKHGMIIELGSSMFQFSKKGNMLKLKAITGPHIDEQFQTDNIFGKITIGRKALNTIACPFDQHMSNQHAQIFKAGDKYFLEDLGATNGTWERLSGDYKPSLPKKLNNKSMIRIAQSCQFMCTIINPSEQKHINPPLSKCNKCHLIDKNCLFLPCKHFLYCSGCTSNMTFCPQCFFKIQEKKRIFQT